MKLKASTVAKLKLALSRDASIIAHPEKVGEHAGNTEAYLGFLGLLPADLRRLEGAGLALRGYTREKRGMRCMWLITMPKGALDGGVNESQEGSAPRVRGEGPDEGGGV